MGYDVWKTLFTDDFNCDKYLYHYTSVENAKLIISCNQLNFSPLNNSNDFIEEKVRISYVNKSDNSYIGNCMQVSQVSEYLRKRSKLLQLLCFSMDSHFTKAKINNLSFIHTKNKDNYFDVTGRGFAIPCMWAKYIPNHNGVCLIINKSAFESFLEIDVDYFVHDKVKYLNYDKYYEIDNIGLDNLYRKVCLLNSKSISFKRSIQRNSDYFNYNFFHKNIAWQQECEYRYVALKNSCNDTSAVSQFSNYLEGIVCDENIDDVSENEINQQVAGICEIRKLSFCDKYLKLL